MTTNPRYPHTCTIYRMEGVTSFSDGELVKVYEGVCRKESSTNIRTFNAGNSTTGKADTADYRVSLPGIVKELQKGDFVDVTDFIGTEKGMRVVYCGASVMANATEAICHSSSN